jgi:uncharacterized protein
MAPRRESAAIGLVLYVHSMYVGTMASLEFEWDPRKAAANLHKHGISFAEAETAFYDDYAAVRDDPDHSEEEDRSSCSA